VKRARHARGGSRRAPSALPHRSGCAGTTSRRSSPRPGTKTPEAGVCLRGSSATSGRTFGAGSWPTDSLGSGVTPADTNGSSRSAARGGVPLVQHTPHGRGRRPSDRSGPLLAPGPAVGALGSETAATPSFPHGCPLRSAGPSYLARIYAVLPLLCPSCGGQMRILAFLTDPPVVQSILVHLDLPHRPPPVAPARGPPQGDFLLDQSPEVDLTEAEPAPAFDFDQSGPELEFD